MKRLLLIVAFGLGTVARPSEGVSHLLAAQVPAGPLATMPPDTEPAFDVATVKPSPGGVDQQGPRYNLRGRTFVARNASLHDLIKFAYGVHASQIVTAVAWVESDRYDVEG